MCTGTEDSGYDTKHAHNSRRSFFYSHHKAGGCGNYMDFFNNPITYTAQNEKIWTGHVSRALH